MAIAKLPVAGIIGNYILSQERIGAPIQTTIPLSGAYTRTQKPEGLIIGGRSEAKYYHTINRGNHPIVPPFGSDQAFTCTKFNNGDGTGYQNIPVSMAFPSGPGHSSGLLIYDQLSALNGFHTGNAHVIGYNAGSSSDVWVLAFIGANSSQTIFHPPAGDFSIVFAISAQDIANVNMGLYPGTPGNYSAPPNAGSDITSLIFALYF